MGWMIILTKCCIIFQIFVCFVTTKNQSTEIALIIYRIAVVDLEVLTSNLFATGEYLAQMNV